MSTYSNDQHIDSPSYFRKVNHARVTSNPRSCDNIMRATISDLCEKPFVKVRPAFLRNPATGRCLELDAYNAELKLACEYNGLQHAVYPNHCHTNIKEFKAQQYRDEIKASMCEANGIRLIVIHHTVPKDQIRVFLQFQLFPSTLMSPSCFACTSEWSSQ